VQDEGIGVPVAEQQQVWERFAVVAGSTVQSGSGVSLGLGLHISKSIIEAHHGHVGLDSAPGQGTTFWFTLPLAHPIASAPGAGERNVL
jgi:signal transduction histidine kinase